MATKKATKKDSGKRDPFVLTKKELEALDRGAKADMKKHGFKTVKELEKYYDSLRGY